MVRAILTLERVKIGDSIKFHYEFTSVPESILLPWHACMKKSLGFPARLRHLEKIIVILVGLTFTDLSAVKGSHILWAGYEWS